MYDYLVDELGIVNGETDKEGRFSLQKVECLGSCGTAPVLQVNDTYYECVTRSRCKHLLAAMRTDTLSEPWRERGGDNVSADKAQAVKAPGNDAPQERGNT
jgi:NADH-quinone oxidoreductase subunit E